MWNAGGAGVLRPKRSTARPWAFAWFIVALTLSMGCSMQRANNSNDSSQSANAERTLSPPSKVCIVGRKRPESGSRRAFPPDVVGRSLSSDIPVTVEMNSGTVPITLNSDESPCAVENFLSLANQGFFDGTSCHRLTTKHIHILQCGDPTGTGEGGPGYRIVDEFDGDERYPAGTVAMARRMDMRDSAGSQFFIVYAGAPNQLPPQFTRLGTVTGSGLKVLRAIADEGTSNGFFDGAPKSPVIIENVKGVPALP